MSGPEALQSTSLRRLTKEGRVAIPISAITDEAMLERLGIEIFPQSVPMAQLSSVGDPLKDLGSRYLIKYVREDMAAHYSTLSGITVFKGPHWLTPTCLHRSELLFALNLPPLTRPVRALLLRPEKLEGLCGPRRIAGGCTVEYVCESFTLDAIADPKWGVLLS
jgi:hypothetical protein